jgi:kynurenine formamidase
MSAPRFVDLSHPVVHGQVTYPGLPAPVISAHLSREASRGHYGPGVEFLIGRIDLVGNTGTYVDAPFHRFADGPDLAQLPLERLADVPGLVVRARDAGRSIGRAWIEARLGGRDPRGRAVLLDTGWDVHFGTPQYGQGHPFLAPDGVDWLVTAGVALVGIDSLNIDDTTDPTRPAHTGLLAAGVTLVEHLRGLDRLPDQGFFFSAVPAPVRGFTTFPVRAFARLPADPGPPPRS